MWGNKQRHYGLISFDYPSGGFIIDHYPVQVNAGDVAIVFVTVIAVGLVAMGLSVWYLTKRLLVAGDSKE